MGIRIARQMKCGGLVVNRVTRDEMSCKESCESRYYDMGVKYVSGTRV